MVGTNDDFEGTSVSQLEVLADMPGRYEVRATAYSSSGSGAYSLEYAVREGFNAPGIQAYTEQGELRSGDERDSSNLGYLHDSGHVVRGGCDGAVHLGVRGTVERAAG